MKRTKRFVILVYRNQDTQPVVFAADRLQDATYQSRIAMNATPSIRMIVIKDNDGEEDDVVIRR